MQWSATTEQKRNESTCSKKTTKKHRRKNTKGRREQLLSALIVDAIVISNQMAKHQRAVSQVCRHQNVGRSACDTLCNAGGGSSLHKNERRGALDAAAAMRNHINGPENQQAFAAERVKDTQHASTGMVCAAHSIARAPLQPHLHFLHDPASLAPSPSQPSSTTCGPCAYRQAQWPVAGTRTPHRGA